MSFPPNFKHYNFENVPSRQPCTSSEHNCQSLRGMSKPRAAKLRKLPYNSSESDKENANDAVYRKGNDLLGDLDLGDSSTTPKIVAAALLSLLPNNATKQHTGAKALVRCEL